LSRSERVENITYPPIHLTNIKQFIIIIIIVIIYLLFSLALISSVAIGVCVNCVSMII
jgi:MFS superfamily sulfate permease-like transporter